MTTQNTEPGQKSRPNHDFLARLDGVAQAELVAKGELSALDLLDAFERRLTALNPLLHAVVTTDLEAGRTRARKGVAGPFGGVPFLFKDITSYPGLRWSIGSRALVARQGHATPFTESCDRAGLVTVGKTAVPEFALLLSTESLLEGVTHNPWDLSRSTSGSSGGPAAAVAAGLVPLAHANDAGGSIRTPASACGVFGLRPSRGRTVDSAPSEPRFAERVAELCVSRSVRDTACFLAAVEDPTSKLPKVGYVRGPDPRRLRIGTYTRGYYGQEPEPDVRAAFDDTVTLCRALGHTVEETKAPNIEGSAIGLLSFTNACRWISSILDPAEKERGRPFGREELEPYTLALLAEYRRQSDVFTTMTRDTAVAVQHAYTQLIAPFDVLLTPVMPVASYPIGYLSTLRSVPELLARTAAVDGYTMLHGIVGTTAMSVPLHISPSGLPIGSHFAGRPGDEAMLLSLAYELEQARPWADRFAPYSIEALYPTQGV
jgi:amidase